MFEGKTESGFAFSVAEGAKDDMELLEALIDLDKGEMGGLKDAIVRLLGKEQKKALYEHCRNGGRVSASAVIKEFAEILNLLPEEEKNS